MLHTQFMPKTYEPKPVNTYRTEDGTPIEVDFFGNAPLRVVAQPLVDTRLSANQERAFDAEADIVWLD